MNGDGYDDVALGAPGYDTGSSQGAVFVFHGGPSGFAGTIPDAADAVLEAGTAGGFGEILAGAGDVNGDGYDDLAVVARAYTNGESEEGAVFVFHGGPTGLGDRSAALADAHVESDQPNARIGFVAGLGDVNGDGYDDLAIGAPDYDGSAEDQGAVFVFHGSPFGIPDGNLSGAATQIGATPDFFYLGWPIAGAGDVNGDGYDDLVVGLQQDFGFQRSAAIFHGSAAGIPSGDVSGAPGYVESLDPFSYYGATAVSGAGDVNGDGYDDLLVAFPSYSEYDDVPGAAFVFHGGSSGIVGVSSDTADTVLQASAPGTSFGSFASGAGDVDGDGYDDVVVAASHEAGMGDDEGAFYVFRGGPGGVADGGPATSWRHVAGQQTGGWFGTGVSRAGDVNGDGRADVIAGAPFYDAGQWDEGIALVFLPEPGAPAGVAAALLLLAALRRARRACAP